MKMSSGNITKKFLWNLGVMCAAQVAVTSYSKASTTTFERRYGLSSKFSSTISLFYNVASIGGLVFTSVCGDRLHRPFWLGIGGIMVSIGAFVNTLPQWLSNPYHEEHVFNNVTTFGMLCPSNDALCTSDANESILFYWILLGEVVMGLGFSGMFSLGMSYLQDASPQEDRAYNQGILLAIFLAGPLISFSIIMPIVSYVFYVDFYRADIKMDHHDPEWVGAWWLAYLIMGGILFIISLGMFTFPRKPPISDDKRQPRANSAVSTLRMIVCPVGADMVKFVPLLLVICHALSSMPISALTTYGGKFLERQYGLVSHAASAYFGMVTVISGMLGTFVGGWYHRRNKMRGHKTAFILVFGTVAATLCVIPTMMIGCDDIDIIGLEFNTTTAQYQVHTECDGCDCPSNELQLVQDSTGQLYASPCAAGCHTELDHSQFDDCRCIKWNSPLDRNITLQVTSKITICSKAKMWSILCLWGVMSFTHGLIGGPYISLFVESLSTLTDQNIKVVAFGLMHFMTKTVGYAPGPYIAGSLIDSACQFWKVDRCAGKLENCQLYEPVSYRIAFGLVMFVPGVIASLGFMWIMRLLSRTRLGKEKTDQLFRNDEH